MHILHIGERSTILRLYCALGKGVQSCAYIAHWGENLAHILRIDKRKSKLAQMLRMKFPCAKYNKPIFERGRKCFLTGQLRQNCWVKKSEVSTDISCTDLVIFAFFVLRMLQYTRGETEAPSPYPADVCSVYVY